MFIIRIILSSAIAKDISKTRYLILEYIDISIYLPGKLDIDELVLVELLVDLYLFDDLKANILLSIDILESEKSNIIISRR